MSGLQKTADIFEEPVKVEEGANLIEVKRNIEKYSLISLISGIASFVLPFLGVVASVLAIIFGNKAVSLALESGTERVVSLTSAKIGRVLGWISILLVAMGLLFFILLISIFGFAL